MSSRETVVINDVGPRDGLQNQPRLLSPEQRLQLIGALVEAGLKHIEFGSLVSPKAVPAMAGTERLAQLLPPGDVCFTALVPNLKGYDIGHHLGLRSMAVVIAASRTMNEKNIRMDTSTALMVCSEILGRSRKDRVAMQAYVATAWECPFEGAMDPGVVDELTGQLLERGAELVVIADTIGAAHPRQIRSLMTRLVTRYGAERLACHFHDTRALGLANADAALEAGIRRFDASVGGLGGCPFAPGATGNVATEDLVMMLELMGLATGIDLDRLLAASRLAGELTGAATGGRALPWLARNTARFARH